MRKKPQNINDTRPPTASMPVDRAVRISWFFFTSAVVNSSHRIDHMDAYPDKGGDFGALIVFVVLTNGFLKISKIVNC